MRHSLWLSIVIVILFSNCAAPRPVLRNPEQVISELQPYYRIFKPDTSAPYRTVLLFHGGFDDPWNCLTKECYKPMIDRLLENGYAAVFIDSFTPRNMTRSKRRSGYLMPPERAGDLYASLEWARQQPWIDKDRIAAIGFSHGGATIMDALVLAPPKKPTGLKYVPSDGLKGLRGVVLYYPYCTKTIFGVRVTYAFDEDWSVPIPVLSFLPALDRQVDVNLCKQILDRHKRKGLPIETVWYEDADHNFDGDYGSQKSHKIGPYNPEAAKDSFERMFKFLKRAMK